MLINFDLIPMELVNDKKKKKKKKNHQKPKILINYANGHLQIPL
jgi:hypothetical protein